MKLRRSHRLVAAFACVAPLAGDVVDAAVVMIENAHKHIEAWKRAHPGEDLRGEAHWRVIDDAAAEIGPALFFSLLIIVLSIVPLFTLEAQEGRMFAPLALTKTYAMAAAAGLSITLILVLMGYLIRGRIGAAAVDVRVACRLSSAAPARAWYDG